MSQLLWESTTSVDVGKVQSLPRNLAPLMSCLASCYIDDALVKLIVMYLYWVSWFEREHLLISWSPTYAESRLCWNGEHCYRITHAGSKFLLLWHCNYDIRSQKCVHALQVHTLSILIHSFPHNLNTSLQKVVICMLHHFMHNKHQQYNVCQPKTVASHRIAESQNSW